MAFLCFRDEASSNTSVHTRKDSGGRWTSRLRESEKFFSWPVFVRMAFSLTAEHRSIARIRPEVSEGVLKI
jgi:hypothetical protein